jgi:ABC-2 type transport system ATP-binding protein
MGTAVAVRGLHKRYGATVAVDDVSFDVGEGEILGLLGPNGSGKTTTVECVQGLRRADRGAIDVFGVDPQRNGPRVRRLVGSQLQDSALPERIKVWEALRLFSTLSPQGPPWERSLDDWGLRGQRNTAFGDLSGGQRQRLFVALALVTDPRMVILDEMTTGLDPAARRVAWDLVAAVRERGTTVVLVTHFMDEASRLCDRVIVLAAGRVVAAGSPAELVAGQARGSSVQFTASGRDDMRYLRGVAGVAEVRRTGNRVVVTGSGPLLARVAHALVARGEEPSDLRVELPSLEDAYLALTGIGARPDGKREE